MSDLIRAQANLNRAYGQFQRRVDVAGRGRRLTSILPMRGGKIIAVGGDRNRSGALPRETELGILAAYKSALRAQAAGEAIMRRMRAER